MDIFGIGSTEIVVIFILATVVLGPLRMIRMARDFGKLVRDLRNYYVELTKSLNEELAVLAELDTANLVSIDLNSPAPEAAQSASPSQEPVTTAETVGTPPTLTDADIPVLGAAQPASPGPAPAATVEPAGANPTDADLPVSGTAQPTSPGSEPAAAVEPAGANPTDTGSTVLETA